MTEKLSGKLAEPLTTLHANLEILSDETPSMKQSSRLQEMLADVEELTRITREIQQLDVVLTV